MCVDCGFLYLYWWDVGGFYYRFFVDYYDYYWVVDYCMVIVGVGGRCIEGGCFGVGGFFLILAGG